MVDQQSAVTQLQLCDSWSYGCTAVQSSVCTIRILECSKCAWNLYNISHYTASFSVYVYCKHKQPCFAFSGTNIYTFLLSTLTSRVPFMEALHGTIEHKALIQFELATKKSVSSWTWKLAEDIYDEACTSAYSCAL